MNDKKVINVNLWCSKNMLLLRFIQIFLVVMFMSTLSADYEITLSDYAQNCTEDSRMCIDQSAVRKTYFPRICINLICQKNVRLHFYNDNYHFADNILFYSTCNIFNRHTFTTILRI